MEKIYFRGVDRFDRPIFKSVKYKNYYGSTNKLVDYTDTEEEILKKVSEKDLTFFGNRFGCEPMGTPAGDIEIVKKPKRKTQ